MIELVKFRVKNYRSIIDSGDCYLANKITILAGKNESGKSSILEALEDFDNEKEIRKSAIPIHDESHKPEIIITFHVEKNIVNRLSQNPRTKNIQ
ncbi:MAG: AAA family ATPase [Candidatus Methanoperedens sp.]|nr:AAA family ATPase [Candidatus Methanoperedens sp.]